MTPVGKKTFFAGSLSILISALMLTLFPGAPAVPMLVGVTIIIFITRLVVSRLQWGSDRLFNIILVFFTIATAGVILNIHGFTSAEGTTAASPELINPDQRRYFEDALNSLDPSLGTPAIAKHHGYGLLVSIIWRFTGISLVYPLLLNLLALVLTLLATGQIAFITAKVKKTETAIASVIILGSICYFLNSATLLLRETLISLSIASFALGCLNISRGKSRILAITTIVSGAGLMALLRPIWVIFLIIPALLLLNSNIKRAVTSTALVIAGTILFLNIFPTEEYTSSLGSILKDNLTSSDGGARTIYWSIIGSDYFSLNPFHKILLLPVTLAVQVLTPFPWNFSRDMIYGLSQFYSHISYPWYAVAGTIIYGFTRIRSKEIPPLIKRCGISYLLLFAAVAYITAGSVSRYALPFLPLAAPFAANVILTFSKEKSFRTYAICYTALTATVLVTIYLFTAQ